MVKSMEAVYQSQEQKRKWGIKKSTRERLVKDFKRYWMIYALAVPVLIYFFVFNYVPMGGLVMAFQDYSPRKGILGSTWVGLKNFQDFFSSYYFIRTLRNTFTISVLDIVVTFPAAIILALLLNEVGNKKVKKVVQTVSYMPYFISTVVAATLLIDFCKTNGVFNEIIVFFGGERSNLLGDPGLFQPLYVLSNLWQKVGYNSIIYMAALSSVDQSLYEAATVDGAGRWKQTLHVTLPSISSTIMITLILRMGAIMSVGFEKIILLYSPTTYETADIISSFTYRRGLVEADYGFSTAVGLFNSVINTVILLAVNKISSKVSETQLF